MGNWAKLFIISTSMTFIAYGVGLGAQSEIVSDSPGISLTQLKGNLGEMIPPSLATWAKNAGGTAQDWGQSVDIDRAGNSYVTGFFSETAIFGSGEENQTELSSAGSLDTFVAKYDRNGSLIWARRDGGSNADRGADIAVDGRGDIFVVGIFSGTIIFDAGEENKTELSSNGDVDIFISKYSKNGDFLWAIKIGGPGQDPFGAIAVDAAGNVYVTGAFRQTVILEDVDAVGSELVSTGGLDTFVAKYTKDGALLWGLREGGIGNDGGLDIAVSNAGNCNVTGFSNATSSPGGVEGHGN